MDAKLKALKVVDLKDILARATVSVPSKSNKQDLIARILASPAAVSVYNAQYGPATRASPSKQPSRSTEESSVATTNDDLLAPPEDVDWTPDDALPTAQRPPSSPTAPTSQTVVLPPSPPKASTSTPSAPGDPLPTQENVSKSPEDEELERRKARAARFGLPLVEPIKSKAPEVPSKPPAKIVNGLVADEPEKLAARAARFGVVPSATVAQARHSSAGTLTQVNGRKRAAPQPDAVDAEESERRKKRAERFGIPVVGAKA